MQMHWGAISRLCFHYVHWQGAERVSPNRRAAAASAAARGAALALVLVGHADEQYEAILQKRLLHLDALVIRLPFLDRAELRKVYAGSDLGIWPGIPSNTIQEAMAGQCALILPDDKIVGHLIDGNGLKESSNCEHAADYVVSLSNDPVRLTNEQSRSATLARRYSWATITKDLLRIYEDFDAPSRD